MITGIVLYMPRDADNGPVDEAAWKLIGELREKYPCAAIKTDYFMFDELGLGDRGNGFTTEVMSDAMDMKVNKAEVKSARMVVLNKLRKHGYV